jgi:type VI secretion system secreted protein Hcp
MAAVDYFLQIDGIKGESKDSKHKDEIELQSFSWGVAQTGIGHSGGGSGAGKASFQDLHFTTEVSSASSKLMIACATGEHIKKAKLTVRKAGKEQQEYYVVKLEDVLISSYQSGGHAGGSMPTDQFSLNFSKIEFEYKPQKADGTLEAGIKSGYDVKSSKKV